MYVENFSDGDQSFVDFRYTPSVERRFRVFHPPDVFPPPHTQLDDMWTGNKMHIDS